MIDRERDIEKLSQRSHSTRNIKVPKPPIDFGDFSDVRDLYGHWLPASTWDEFRRSASLIP